MIRARPGPEWLTMNAVLELGRRYNMHESATWEVSVKTKHLMHMPFAASFADGEPFVRRRDGLMHVDDVVRWIEWALAADAAQRLRGYADKERYALFNHQHGRIWQDDGN